jgi:5-methylcytosine-specific restriction endonuclease McrA
MKNLRSVSDNELINRLRNLVDKEKKLALEILPHLAEVGARGLYLAKGYCSLYEYCRNELGYSDASAWRRVRAVRAIQRCPGAYQMLVRGRVTMCTLGLVCKFITPEILERICDKAQAEVTLIAAVFDAKGVAPDKTRPVMVPKTLESSSRIPSQSTNAADDGLRSEVGAVDQPLKFEKKWKVDCVVSVRVKEKLDRCKTLLSNKYPKGVDYDVLLDELTEIFLDRKDPKRKKERREQRRDTTRKKSIVKSRNTSANKTNSKSRHIPQQVREKVWARDNGRCAFVGVSGKRCNSAFNLQFDHYPVLFARGGPSKVNNLRLLCAKHNKFTAQQVYGKKHMESFLCRRE